ncbi:MAG: hypothetical protein LBL05_05770 [Synergistaceae bacterium]|nr:hypothetical protein [Synergistaceae bacterium]
MYGGHAEYYHLNRSAIDGLSSEERDVQTLPEFDRHVIETYADKEAVTASITSAASPLVEWFRGIREMEEAFKYWIRRAAAARHFI